MKLRPLPGRVLVRPDKKPELQTSDIWTPEPGKTNDQVKWQENGLVVVGGQPLEQIGVVVGVGRSVDPVVAVGDRVLFSALKGQAIETKSQRFLSIREQDLLAVLE